MSDKNQLVTKKKIRWLSLCLAAVIMLAALPLHPMPARADTATGSIAAGIHPAAIAVNPATNKIYIANNGSRNVTVIEEQAVQEIDPAVTISSLPGHVTANPSPDFSFSTTTNNPLPVQQIWHQLDTMAGAWQKALPGGGSAGVTLPSLALGAHILYAMATDGQDSTSINTGSGSSPVTGKIAAYAFTVIAKDENDITAFTVPGQVGNALIDTTAHTVIFYMPFGSTVTALTPAISVSEDATVSPLSGEAQDFTNPVTYTVTAQNGAPQVWTATVIVSTDKTLVSITAPSAITDVANGAAKTAEALGLPAKVTLVTSDGDVQADVSWDAAACSYDPTVTTEQTFTVCGTVTLPAGVINPGSVPLTTSISVTVNMVVPDPTYTLTITAETGGSITTGSSGNYTAGTTIAITATPASGYSFNKWTSTGGGAFANANSASTTYTMPANPAAITATFTYNGSSGGSSGGSPAGTQVTPSGGTFSQNGVTLTFPAGAVESDIRVIINQISQSSGLNIPDGSQLLSRIMDIIKNISGNFLKPVTITLSFDKSGINPDEYDIAIYCYDEDTGKWIALDNIRLNLETGTISGDTTHFTKFAVIATPKVIEAEKPSQPVTPQPAVNIPGDIPGHWAKDSILRLINSGVISGYPDGTFQPDKTVTRAEFTVMLVKALKLEAKAWDTFEDSSEHWAKDSIVIAAAHGIISGYSKDTFGPDDLITREQAAVIIARAAQLEAATGELNFTDSQSISPWAKPGVAAAFKAGFITGYADGSFRPRGKTTRAEAAVIIGKLL